MPEHFAFNLNDEQFRAVTHAGHPLIVLAGPGSGKTSVIVHRIAHLIEERGAEPESIVALTFTNKAAEEMRRRLAELLGSTARAERVIASTFHSFGLRLIRQFADLVGLRPEPLIIDEAQQRALLRSIIDSTRIGIGGYSWDPYAALPDTLTFISLCRNQAIYPGEVLAFVDTWQADLEARRSELSREERLAEETKLRQFADRAKLFEHFERACLERGWVTFDDLQTLTLRLLQDDERIRAIVRTDFRHVVVDEFQDVNRAQIELLKCMASIDHDLCVVGDDDQAIYGFRGSSPNAFRQMKDHWTNAEVIELTNNYRSTGVIISAADRIIERCEERFEPDKTLIAAGENAELNLPIECVTYEGANGAGAVIGEMLLDASGRADFHWGDAAVLVRTNTELDRIAAALQALDIPIDIPERGDALSHPAVQDVMSWLRILDDPSDDAHCMRLLARPPFNLDLPTLTGWHREYKWRAGESARDASNQLDAEELAPSHADFNTFLDELPSFTDDPAVSRFAGMYNTLAHEACTKTADELALAIMHQSGLLTLDPVNPEAHRSRVEHLGRFLGFVRERMPMLESPRRVHEFLRYVDDLIDAGASVTVGTTPEDRMDSGVELSQRDAVRLLTAHKAKGLEFETVFVPHVNSPHGYPYRAGGMRSNDDLMPDGLAREAPPNRDDEERRLFFVALTRARRQAVILAMVRQDNGRNKNPSEFWDDLVRAADAAPAIPVRVRSADDVIAEISTRRSDEIGDGDGDGAGAPQPSLMMPRNADGKTHALRLRERYKARHRIYAILHELHHASLSTVRIGELQHELERISLRLPILAAEDATQLQDVLNRMPVQWRDELTTYAESIVSREPWYELLPAPKAPLTLSYSDIYTYLDCPRCYWLRKVVGLPQPGAPAANFGSIIHRTLEFFYRKMQRAESADEPTAPPTLDDLLELGRASYEDLRHDDEPWDAKVAEQIETTLRRYYETLHSSSINPIEIERAITFDYEHEGRRHRIKVRIDRVDADQEGFHLIDYKTGRPTRARLEPQRTDLQMGIYLLALRHFLEDDEPTGTAEYWLTATGERGIVNLENINLKSVCGKIDKAIAGILAGNWEKKKDCPNCELVEYEWSPEMDEAEAEASP